MLEVDVADSEDVYQSVASEFSRARDVVFNCLKNDERCRNDDQWLMLQVWKSQGLLIMIDFSKWKEMFSPETIRRVRQDIQSTHNDLPGMFLPTDPEVLYRRKVRECAIRDYYGAKSWILSEFRVRKYDIRTDGKQMRIDTNE